MSIVLNFVTLFLLSLSPPPLSLPPPTMAAAGTGTGRAGKGARGVGAPAVDAGDEADELLRYQTIHNDTILVRGLLWEWGEGGREERRG